MKAFNRLAVLISIVTFCCTPSLRAAPPPLPEDKPLSLDLQNANLKDVLKIFSIQSGLNFIADQNVEERKITLYLDKVPMKEAMNRLFEANNLTYEFNESSNIFIVHYWGDPQIATMTKIYRLMNRSVSTSSLEKEKKALFAESGVGNGLKSTTSSASDKGEEDVLLNIVKQALSKDGKVLEDTRTNSIIVTDLPSRFPMIDELIAQLDVPQPQIMLEVEMLDVNRSVIDNLGMDISMNPITLNFSRGTTSLNGLKFFAGASAETGAAGALSIGRHYAALLDFLRTQTDTRFLARPRIMTLNNETAEIGITKDEIVSSQQTTTAIGTSSQGITSSVTYERATSLSLTPEGIGIFLRVTPQVNLETGDITMVVNPKSSSASQSPYVPISQQIALDPEVRTTKSIVKIKDGETIVLGGLIHKERQETVSKVPFLGDIPFAGALFRHKSVDVDVDRELLVFITPHIVKDPNVQYNAHAAGTTIDYAMRYLSSGAKRQEEITDLLDVYEQK